MTRVQNKHSRRPTRVEGSCCFCSPAGLTLAAESTPPMRQESNLTYAHVKPNLVRESQILCARESSFLLTTSTNYPTITPYSVL